MHPQSTTTPPHTGHVRVARVARVSTVDQEVYGTSLPDQLAKESIYADLHDMVVVDAGEYSGDESGALPLAQRPILQRLLTDARAGNFDAVVWHKIDRIARSARAILEVWATLEDLGITIHVIEPHIDSSDAFGRLMRTILAAFAEFERDMLVARTGGALVRKAQRGELFLPGRKYGYTYVRKDSEEDGAGKVRVKPEQAQVVQRIFVRRAQHATPGRIARELTVDAVPSPSGKAYWNESSIVAILRDPAYKGERAWGQYKRCISKNGKRTSRRVVRADKAIPLHYPVIVDDALWHAAQEAACGARAQTERAAPGTFLLSGGRLVCAEHGRGMVGATGGRNFKQYRCQRPNERGGRSVHTTPAAALEDVVWGEVMAFLLDSTRGLRAARRLAEEASVSLEDVRAGRAACAARREEIARQRRWVLDTARQAGATTEEVAEQLGTLGQQMAEIEREDKRLAAQEALAGEDIPQAQAIARICTGLAERAQSMERPERAALLEDLEVRCTLDGGQVHIEGKVREMERWVALPGAEALDAKVSNRLAPTAFVLVAPLPRAS